LCPTSDHPAGGQCPAGCVATRLAAALVMPDLIRPPGHRGGVSVAVWARPASATIACVWCAWPTRRRSRKLVPEQGLLAEPGGGPAGRAGGPHRLDAIDQDAVWVGLTHAPGTTISWLPQAQRRPAKCMATRRAADRRHRSRRSALPLARRGGAVLGCSFEPKSAGPGAAVQAAVPRCDTWDSWDA
jgi:hypothetical protein